jgi:hypothetical protein
MAALGCTGESDSWQGQQANVRRIFEVFRTSVPSLTQCFPLPWAELSEGILCSADVYSRFAHYLLYQYTIGEGAKNAGEHLRASSVLNFLGCLINLAAAKFKAAGSADTKLFFTCLDNDSTTEAARWYKGTRKKIKRILFERLRDSGDPIGNSEGATLGHCCG